MFDIATTPKLEILPQPRETIALKATRGLPMKIVVVGTGRVGLVTGTCLAENGHFVTCVGRDATLVKELRKGTIPFYEPGLEELLVRNLEEERLCFETGLGEAVSDCLLIFLCIGVSETESGEPNLQPLLDAASGIGAAMTGYRILVNKSTCPVGTAEQVQDALRKVTTHPFDVVVNPEFLKEGAAVDDFMRPDRIVIGCEDVRVLEIMRELYAPFLRTGKPFISMGIRSAELAKYATDTMLAARITLMNELANVAEAYGADISEIQNVLMSDSRIGSTYLFPGIGMGGAWLPRSPGVLARLASEKDLPCGILEGIGSTNDWQQDAFVRRILTFYGEQIKEKRIAIWGVSFKPKTDDLRNAPALRVIDGLIKAGAEVRAYDPVAGKRLKEHYGDKVTVAPKMYACIEETDGVVICTEWREFHYPDFERMANSMRQRVIFDGRNLFTPKTLQQHDFTYFGVGRQPIGA